MIWTIGKRITVGFSITLFMLAVTTIMSYSKIGNIAHLSHLSTQALETKTFLVEKEIDHINWLNNLSSSLLNHEKITVLTDPHKCGFGKWLYKQLEEKSLPSSVMAVLHQIEPLHKSLHTSVNNIKQHYTPYNVNMDKQLDKIWIAHLLWMQQMQTSLLEKKVFSGQTNSQKCGFGKWYKKFITDNTKLKDSIEKWVVPHKKLHDAAAKVKKYQKNGQLAQAFEVYNKDIIKYFKQIKNAHQETEEYLHKLSTGVYDAHKIYQTETSESANKVGEKLHEVIEALDTSLIAKVGSAVKDIAGTASFAKIFMIIFGGIAVVVGAFLAFFITRSIVKPVVHIGESLETISANVGAASTELSDASQELSSMSSEQASSVEETSSSLEEIEGMVQNNIGHAEESVGLSNKVKDIADEGSNVMDNLAKAMNDILDSNRKIEQLVKVIGDIGEKTKIMDEIVFQTKLLSFNASVEAERAGEHGRGFAVVAQEVGNLAQMSGKSAAEIATIVRDSVKGAEQITTENKSRVEVGGKLVEQMAASLKEIVTGASSVSQGASGVLAASTDQGKGIKQINIAMTEIDKVTQETAATAEETASSSEELSAQVDSLREIVKELTLLVIGRVNNMENTSILAKAKAPTTHGKSIVSTSTSSDGWDEL